MQVKNGMCSGGANLTAEIVEKQLPFIQPPLVQRLTSMEHTDTELAIVYHHT